MSCDFRPIAVAPEVDNRTGTVEVLIEAERDVDELKPGLRATAEILLPGEVEGLVLPHAAVIDDAGIPVVYVQLSGESFVRRVVSVEKRQGESLLVTSVVVRLAEGSHQHYDELGRMPILTDEGRTIRLADVANVRQDLGPSIVRRETVRRVAVLTANVVGRDLTGTVDTARRALEEGLDLASGYSLDLGGQFETAARSLTVIGVLSVVVLLAMYGLLFFAFSSHRQALFVLVNFPLAVVGGVIAVALGHGVLSVASLLGFITLFGIATRKGVLLVTRYQQLLQRGGTSVTAAVVQGSVGRMAPVLMTALTAGLAPHSVGARRRTPGNEILSPTGEVILGGLLSSTALNLVVVPALFARWGVRDSESVKKEADGRAA